MSSSEDIISISVKEITRRMSSGSIYQYCRVYNDEYLSKHLDLKCEKDKGIALGYDSDDFNKKIDTQIIILRYQFLRKLFHLFSFYYQNEKIEIDWDEIDKYLRITVDENKSRKE